MHKKDYVCQFGQQNVGKRPFPANLFLRMFVLHISFGLPGPLRTAFELKIALLTANTSIECNCANGKCY